MDELVQLMLVKLGEYTPQLIWAMSIFIFFWTTGILLRALIIRFSKKSKLNDDVCELFGKIAKTTLILVGIVTAFGTVGVDISALVAGLGLTGFALGFALKDLLSNVLAGVLILIYRPYVKGDTIEFKGVEKGRIIEIDLRYTTIVAKKKKIFIPNSMLFSNAITLFECESDEEQISDNGNEVG